MRQRLIVVFVAVSTLVTVAFVLPLGYLVRRTAEDRAIDAARADAAAVVPALVSEGSRAQIESAVGATGAGREGRVTVLNSQGWIIGEDVESSRVELALTDGTSDIGEVEGGVEVVAAVATGAGELYAIRVFVADDTLYQGQYQAWAALAAVGIALVGISVLVADRLARTIVRPTQDLAEAARRLGAGDLNVTVDPEGPPELLALGNSFNQLGLRVGEMLDRERELVAELSHRLRTPLTKVRLRIDQVEDPELAAELSSDIADLTLEVNRLIDQARGVLTELTICDAVSVVSDRADYWSALAEDQQRPWQLVCSGDFLPVDLPEAELSAAVDVLLENVFSHTDEGVAVTVGVIDERPEARIWVENGGTYAAPVAIEEGQSTSGSSGIGLSIARRSAERAGGYLEIGDSGLGGILVAIVLPIIEE